ncbi:phosphoethanolamine transferase eptA domain protein, partial [Escherichia coli PA15]
MKRKEFNSRKAVNSENVLDILYRTGVNLLWIENDGGCKGVCKRIPTINIEP